MGRGTFGGEFEARHCNLWGLYGVRVRPSSQITLRKLVIFITRSTNASTTTNGTNVTYYTLTCSMATATLTTESNSE